MVKTKTEPVARPPRQLKQATYRSFSLQKPIKQPHLAKLPNSFRLFAMALATLKKRWKIFALIMVVYGVLALVLVRGLSMGGDFADFKETLDSLGKDGGVFVQGTILFSYLIGTSSSVGGGAASVFQVVLIVLFSLMIIWTLRQVEAAKTFHLREVFYDSCYPLVQYVLVLCVVLLQLTPFILGGFMFGIVSNTAAGGLQGPEIIAWGLLLFLLVMLSLYMLASSLFGLFIVCLPHMRPLTALRSARELVRYRRWSVMRKIFLLPIFLLLLAAVCMIPVVIWLPAAATWVFFVFSLGGIPVTLSYMYNLYRKLL